ncbi:MAG: hypothetical protein ACYTG5_12885 [Planctomycetota bacterium]|jgi:hypothetical protein
MYAPRAILALASACLLFAANTRAQDPQSVPLGYGVPHDAHYYVHGMTSETPDPGTVMFENMLGKLVDSGIHEDLFDLATVDLKKERRMELRAAFDHVMNLCGMVDWALLGKEELVFAYKMSLPLPEYVALFRVPADQVAGQIEGMEKLMGQLSMLLGVQVAPLRNIELEAGTLKALEVPGAPLQFAAGGIGDVFVLSTSSRLAVSTMKRLARGDGRGSLVTSDHFAKSVSKLPKATEATFFVDIEGLLGFFEQAMLIAQANNRGGQGQAEMLSLMTAIFDEIGIARHVLVSMESDGQSATSTALVAMQPGYEDSNFAQLFVNQQPWTDWTRYVPAEASEFYFDSGIDLAGLCDLGIQIVRENLRQPEIPMMVMKQLRDGLFANISGEAAYVMLPAMDGGCPLGEMVSLWRLNSSEGVLHGIERTLEGVSDMLANKGQELDFIIRDESIELDLPAFPWIRPTIAIREGCLVLATSPTALNKIDRVYMGEEPSIRSCEDFAAMGVGKGKDAQYLAYGYMDSGMDGLANLVSGAGFFMSLMPEQKDTRVAIKLGAVLTKLGPALRELQMEFDWGTEILPSEDPDVVMSRTVYRYR